MSISSDNQPEVLPITSLEELLKWNGPDANLVEILKTLPAVRPSSVKMPLENCSFENCKTIVCHDHNNGYGDDRFCRGTENRDAFRFYNWYGLDMFIYFSHNLVTIPPCGWVNAAHIHGVKILGTLITEWSKGTDIWNEILNSQTTVKSMISQLIAVTKVYRFDGWLINVENTLTNELVSKLISFVQQLTIEIHKLNSSFVVIWYDAITIEGKLEWQDELNSKNKPFFDVSDGIFVNYNWLQKNLENSVLLAGDRKSRVYMGIDVYGRFKTHGGFDIGKSLKLIREYSLSCAIFANSWTYDAFGKDNQFYTSTKLWNSCKPYLLYHGFKDLPFQTSFCQGFGRNYYLDGLRIRDGPWFNLMEQNPQVLLEEFDSTMCIPNTDQAFNGGSTFTFFTSDPKLYRLLLCDFPLKKLNTFSIAYKFNGKLEAFIIIFKLSTSRLIHLYVKSSNNQLEISEEHKDILISKIDKDVDDWKMSTFRFYIPAATENVTSILIGFEGSCGVGSLGAISIK